MYACVILMAIMNIINNIFYLNSTRFGELRGEYGSAYLPNENDCYNTLPFGDLPPRAPATPSTQRGFYNEEFAPLKLHSTKDECMVTAIIFII